MCEKVQRLFEIYESIESSKNIIPNDEYILKLKELKRSWISVALSVETCTEQLNEIGDKILFSISLN